MSGWEWAGPDLALALALWPQDQFLRPRADPNHDLHVTLMAQRV